MRTWRLGRLGVGFLFQRSPAMRISEKDAELGSWINDFPEQKPWCFLRVYPQHFQANPKGPKGPIVSGRFRKHLYKFIIIYRGTCGLPLFFQPASWKRSSMVLAHLLRREVGSSVSQYLDMCPTWVKWILCSSKLPKTSSLHWPEILTHTHSIGGESWIGTFLIARIFADFCMAVLWDMIHFETKPFLLAEIQFSETWGPPKKSFLVHICWPQTSIICSLSNVFVPPICGFPQFFLWLQPQVAAIDGGENGPRALAVQGWGEQHYHLWI